MTQPGLKIQKVFTLFLDLVASMVTTRGMRLSPLAVDPGKYLRTCKMPQDIYEKSGTELFYNPFTFNHDDFGRLILIRIDGHHEIHAVELIVQDENKGAVVVVYYHNGKVENYLNQLFSSEKEYVKLDKNWKIIEDQEFEYIFKDTPKGINFDLDIKINGERRIKINLQENRKEEKRFSVLATVGAELREVKRFPFIYLKEAGLIPVEGTEVSFELDGRKMELSKPPVKVEGKHRFRSVFSFSRLPFFWNEEQDSYLSPEKLDNTQTFMKGNAVYSFSDNNSHKEIETITYNAHGHSSSFRFSPAFPDIASLKAGSKINGKFCLGVDDIDGVIGGKYSVINRDGEISIDFQPEKCWGPIGNKNWVSAYHYHAKLKLAEDNKFKLQSNWIVN